MAVGATLTSDLLDGLSLLEKSRVATILRIIGRIYCHNTTVNAQAFGRWGIHLLSDDAMAVPAVLEPIEDHKASWMWNDRWFNDSGEIGRDPYIKEFDMRAGRRIPNLFTLAFVIQSSAASNGGAFLSAGFRLLYSVK